MRGADLAEIEAREFDELDSSRQGLRCVLHELRGCAAEQEETSPAVGFVDDHSQFPEDVWLSLHLVDDDQSVVSTEREARVRRALDVDRGLEIEVLRHPAVGRECSGQGRLAALSGTE
jgi:hypothetical protein